MCRSTPNDFSEEGVSMTGNRFIVIEGLDATGKSTLVDKLAKQSASTQLDYQLRRSALSILTRMPYSMLCFRLFANTVSSIFNRLVRFIPDPGATAPAGAA